MLDSLGHLRRHNGRAAPVEEHPRALRALQRERRRAPTALRATLAQARTPALSVVPPADTTYVGPVEPIVPAGTGVVAGVTAIVVSFNTVQLTRTAVRTLRQAYPELHVILIDNGSVDGSADYVRRAGEDARVDAVINPTNTGHGPALHQGIRRARTDYVLLLDADCVVHRGGFIEAMLARFEVDALLYAVGWRRTISRQTGVGLEHHITRPSSPELAQYVHPSCALIDRAKYLKLPPAFHHGAPLLQNMLGAERVGYHLEDFPVSSYVEHLIAGARRRYGGNWNPGQAAPGAWRANVHEPI